MAIRQMRYNDDEILRKRCKEVKEVDDKIRVMLDDMLDTLRHTENGAALAANQVGILKRLVVIEYCGELLKLVNPKIIGRSGTQECIEGCMSFPGKFVNTIRPQKVTVQALDEYGQGKWQNVIVMSWSTWTVKFFWTRRSESLIEDICLNRNKLLLKFHEI